MSTVEEKFSRVTGIEGEQVASLAKGVAAAQYRESAQRVMAITVSLQVAEALENLVAGCRGIGEPVSC
jgi:hypothetical protein